MPARLPGEAGESEQQTRQFDQAARFTNHAESIGCRE
jgi:hypothetical protein